MPTLLHSPAFFPFHILSLQLSYHISLSSPSEATKLPFCKFKFRITFILATVPTGGCAEEREIFLNSSLKLAGFVKTNLEKLSLEA